MMTEAADITEKQSRSLLNKLELIADDPSIPEQTKINYIIHGASILCAITDAQPIPFADIFVLTPIQAWSELGCQPVLDSLCLGKPDEGRPRITLPFLYMRFCRSLRPDGSYTLESGASNDEMRQLVLNRHRYLAWTYGLLALVMSVPGFITCPSLPRESRLFVFNSVSKAIFGIVLFLGLLRWSHSVIRYAAGYASMYRSVVAPLVQAILFAILFWYGLDRGIAASNTFQITIRDAAAVKSYYYPRFLFGILCVMSIWHCVCYCRLRSDHNRGVSPMRKAPRYP